MQAPTSSSLGRAAATKSVLGEIGVANNKDPMQKKLLEFRQKKSSTATAIAGAGNSKAPTKGQGAISKTTSVQTVAAIQAKPARGRAASTRGKTSVASAHADAAPRAAVRGSRSASLKGSVASAAGAPARGMAGTANSTPRGVSLGVSSASIAGGAEAKAKKSVSSSTNVHKNVPKTVSKPVTTVKRSVSGNGGGVGGPKSAREQSTGVKRKGPTVLSSNVTDRTKRCVAGSPFRARTHVSVSPSKGTGTQASKVFRRQHAYDFLCRVPMSRSVSRWCLRFRNEICNFIVRYLVTYRAILPFDPEVLDG